MTEAFIIALTLRHAISTAAYLDWKRHPDKPGFIIPDGRHGIIICNIEAVHGRPHDTIVYLGRGFYDRAHWFTELQLLRQLFSEVKDAT